MYNIFPMFKYNFISETDTMCFAFFLLFINMSMFRFVYCYGLYLLLLIIIIINQYFNCFSNHYNAMICGLSFEFIYVNDYTSTVRSYCGVLWSGWVSGLNLNTDTISSLSDFDSLVLLSVLNENFLNSNSIKTDKLKDFFQIHPHILRTLCMSRSDCLTFINGT